MKGPGPLILLSGPSGAGKSTVIKRLLACGDLPLHLSVSATTRPRRQGEKEGVDYYFWTPEQFEEGLRAGAFLEHARVHGDSYGTLRSEVDNYRPRGIGVVLDIDTQGADQVRRLCPDHVSVFLQAPSLGDYERRLRERGTEGEAAIRKRLAAAQAELARAGEYQYRVVNDDLDTAVEKLHEILRHQFERDEHVG